MLEPTDSDLHHAFLVGALHQEIHSYFVESLQVPLGKVPPDIYAELVKNIGDASRVLEARGADQEALKEFDRALDLLSRDKVSSLQLSDEHVDEEIRQSHAIAIRIDHAMRRVRESISNEESATYALGVCTTSLAFRARLVLVAPIVFSGGGAQDTQLTRLYFIKLLQTAIVVIDLLDAPGWSRIFEKGIARLYADVLRRIVTDVANSAGSANEIAKMAQVSSDNLLNSVDHESVFARILGTLHRTYATDAAFHIDLLQFLASLLTDETDEFDNTYGFHFGAVPLNELPKVFAGGREAIAFSRAFKLTPEFKRELSWNPLFGRADLAQIIQNGLNRIPPSCGGSFEFKTEGKELGVRDYYGTFHGAIFLFQLLLKSVTKIVEFQMHIATRTRRDPRGGHPIAIPEGMKLLPPDDWGYHLSYVDASRLFSPTHAAWARRARQIGGIERHTGPPLFHKFDSSVTQSEDAWDVDSHAIASALGIGRKPIESRITTEDKEEIYKSGIRRVDAKELHGEHLSSYLFDTSHDYASEPRHSTADHDLYQQNVFDPPTELFVDSYYQSTFLPSHLVAAGLYGKFTNEEESLKRSSMRARHKRIPFSTARSYEELGEILDQIGDSQPGKTLLYRGQSRHYRVFRTPRVCEFLYGDKDVNELSLNTTASRSGFAFDSFLGRFQLQLQGLLYRDIPVEVFSQLAERQRRAFSPFAHPYLTMTYRTWNRLYCESQWDVLASGLAQHYGIPTHGLDLTASVDVAVWFALNEIFSHTFSDQVCHWYQPRDFWSSDGDDRPVIYVLAVDPWLPRQLEALQTELPLPEALRPDRQAAYLHHGGWGLQSNACAEDVEHAIFLQPGFRAAREFSTSYIFPDRKEDDFYDALLELKTKTASTTDSITGYEYVLHYREPFAPTRRTRDREELGERLFGVANMERFTEALELIDAGADVNFRGQTNEWQGGGTALHWAALYGNVELVQKLLLAGASVNLKDNVGRTALFPAAANRHREVVRILLEHGADVRAMEYRGWALIPPERRDAGVVSLLRQYGYVDPGMGEPLPLNTREKLLVILKRSAIESPVGDSKQEIKQPTRVTMRRLSRKYLVNLLRHSVINWNVTRRVLSQLVPDLTHANLFEVDLIGANLKGAILCGADLRSANLMGASLENADLKGADFEWATISDVNFRGARNLDQANMVDVYWDVEPKWPDDFNAEKIDRH
jgi:hypothetical protein